ncbi:MAG: PAS domain S-box protein [Vicinamibacterales bacterium]
MPALAPDFPKTLLDTLDEVVYALDLHATQTLVGARVTFVSQRVRDVLGYEPDQFMADPSLWFSLLHPEDREGVARSSAQILESRAPGRRHFRLRHRHHQDYLWFEDSVVPQFGADGEVVGMVGAARDVTARRRVAHQMAVLLENARDGFFTIDSDGVCRFANPAGVRLMGRPATEIVGAVFHELLNEPERSQFRRNHARALAEGVVVRASGFCTSLKRWLDTAFFPGPDGTMVNFRDVTEQRTSEERLRSWVDDAPVGLFRTVPYGRMLDANGTALTMLGYPTVEALREKNSLDLIVESSDSGPGRMNLDTFDRISGLPITLRRLDGSHLPVLMNLHVLRDHSGQPAEVLGSFQDLSDPERLRTALLSSARRYRILFDQNVTPMMTASPEGTVLSHNRALLRLLGLDEHASAESGGNLVDHLVQPGQGIGLLEGARLRGRVENHDLLLRRADGTTRRVLASARVASESADTAFVEISFVDIEDRCRIEDELRRAVGEREFLLRELHHRVKNNLQLISSLLSLQARETDTPLLHEFAQKTRDRILAMAVVHERLYQSDTTGTACVLGYLEALLRNLADSHDAVARGISLEVSGDCAEMSIDQTMRCGLIVNELVMNALKHAFDRSGGTVHVVVAVVPGAVRDVRVTITDNGRGVPADFDPARIQTLGVQMVDNLVRQSGGTVRWLPGQPGTTVQFALPLEPTRPEVSV